MLLSVHNDDKDYKCCVNAKLVGWFWTSINPLLQSGDLRLLRSQQSFHRGGLWKCQRVKKKKETFHFLVLCGFDSFAICSTISIFWVMAISWAISQKHSIWDKLKEYQKPLYWKKTLNTNVPIIMRPYSCYRILSMPSI